MADILNPETMKKNPLHSPRKIILSGLGIMVLFLGGFALWAAFAPLESAVQAQGEITFDTKRKTVQHLEGGILPGYKKHHPGNSRMYRHRRRSDLVSAYQKRSLRVFFYMSQ